MVLHHIELYWQHGATHHFHAQRVTLFLTQQTAPFDDSHPIATDTTRIRCLVHILDTLSHVYIMLALHGRLTIEGLQQLRHLTVVLRYLLDSDVHQLTRVIGSDHNLAQLYRGRLQTNLQVLRLLF